MIHVFVCSEIDTKAQMETVSQAVDRVVTKIAEIPFMIAGENPHPDTSDDSTKPVKFVFQYSSCVFVCL